MDLFFSRRIPNLDRVVLVESGPRNLYDGFVGDLYTLHGQNIQLDLVTCYTGEPAGFRPANGAVYRVQDYRGWDGAKRLVQILRGRRVSTLGIICAGVPVMANWKWMLLAGLRAKVFVMNENGDYFWVDYSNWKLIGHFMLFRAGMSGDNGIWLPLRMLVFPFGLLFLAAYAGWVHARRWIRSL
ncbi:MAG: hypothetical protein ACK5TN_04135 [Acidobacteriota bacterium]